MGDREINAVHKALPEPTCSRASDGFGSKRRRSPIRLAYEQGWRQGERAEKPAQLLARRGNSADVLLNPAVSGTGPVQRQVQGSQPLLVDRAGRGDRKRASAGWERGAHWDQRPRVGDAIGRDRGGLIIVGHIEKLAPRLTRDPTPRPSPPDPPPRELSP